MKSFFIAILSFLALGAIVVPIVYFINPALIESFLFLEERATIQKVGVPKNSPNEIKVEQVVVHNVEEKKLLSADVYYAICGKENRNPEQTEFISCQTCPSYLSSQRKPFEFLYFFQGHFTNPDKDQILVFMKGCEQDEFSHGIVIMLERVYTSWERLSFYENISFTQKPLVFNTPNNTSLLVGQKRRDDKSAETKIESLVSLQFHNKDVVETSILEVHDYYGLSCYDYIEGRFDPPQEYYEGTILVGTSVVLEILNSNIPAPGKCPKSTHYELISGRYTLKFGLHNSEFIPTKETSSILTGLERSIEH